MIHSIHLSPRLQSIANEVPHGVVVADVGTDHAYLPVWLLLEGRVPAAIAADLRGGPLERARLTALRYGVPDLISLRLCDGLSAISAEEAEYITIAGMGGETIAAILEQASWSKGGNHVLLLQPMSSQNDLRKYLTEQGYFIEKEILSREGDTIYLTLRVRGGKSSTYSLAERWVGRQERSMCSPLRLPYMDQTIHRLSRALSGLSMTWQPEQKLREAEYIQALDGIRALREEWVTWQQ